MVIRHVVGGGGGTVMRVLLMLLLSVIKGRHIENIRDKETRYKNDSPMRVKVEEMQAPAP